MLNHVTDTGKSDPRRDVVTAIVQTSNFVVLYHVSMHRVIISDGQREASCGEVKRRTSLYVISKLSII